MPKRLEVKAALGKSLIVFTNFRSGTPACRQVTLENSGTACKAGV